MDEAFPPWYPCWGIEFMSPVLKPRSTIDLLFEARPNDSWLLLAWDCIASERHIWAVWQVLQRRIVTDSMRSNSLDGEFMRLLSGTHQVALGIKRSGITKGDRKVWLVHIPSINESEIGSIPDLDLTKLSKTVDIIQKTLQAEIVPARPVPMLSGLHKLGILDGMKDDPPPEIWENLFLNHITHADLPI